MSESEAAPPTIEDRVMALELVTMATVEAVTGSDGAAGRIAARAAELVPDTAPGVAAALRSLAARWMEPPEGPKAI